MIPIEIVVIGEPVEVDTGVREAFLKHALFHLVTHELAKHVPPFRAAVQERRLFDLVHDQTDTVFLERPQHLLEQSPIRWLDPWSLGGEYGAKLALLAPEIGGVELDAEVASAAEEDGERSHLAAVHHRVDSGDVRVLAIGAHQTCD